MAKNMARIENGIVVNLEWCANACEETDTLKDTNGLLIETGDTYDGSAFYHNGERILTQLEKLQLELELQKQINQDLLNQLQGG